MFSVTADDMILEAGAGQVPMTLQDAHQYERAMREQARSDWMDGQVGEKVEATFVRADQLAQAVRTLNNRLRG